MFESKYYSAHIGDDVSVAKCAGQRGKFISYADVYGKDFTAKRFGDSTKLHDATFALLQNELAKIHEKPYEPLTHFTYAYDIPVVNGGGFVDAIEYTVVDWAGLQAGLSNVNGNNSNIVPRVNAYLTQNKVGVFTYELGYDFNFIELEKADKLKVTKSIKDIYETAMNAGWELFCERVGYLGMGKEKGLFNSDDKVVKTDIDNKIDVSGNRGFAESDDATVVAFFNGIFTYYLEQSNMNFAILPDTFLVPTFVAADLVNRFSALYTNTLLDFIKEHNLNGSISEDDAKKVKIKIKPRKYLNDIGVHSKGRIVAYKNDPLYVRMDLTYAFQHYITLPNPSQFAYTSLFVGQVSGLQLMYNRSETDLGVVTYWDFKK